ncbi:MAG TPA: hypothetical protein VIW69_00095 [Candidatus Elarobacter sp.]
MTDCIPRETYFGERRTELVWEIAMENATSTGAEGAAADVDCGAGSTEAELPPPPPPHALSETIKRRQGNARSGAVGDAHMKAISRIGECVRARSAL